LTSRRPNDLVSPLASSRTSGIATR
jgi:hypothetical protein